MTQTPEHPDPLIGQTVDEGRYEIRDVIGHGGMGSVYLAHQRSVDRVVAIKFIHPRLLIDHTLQQRFHREATVMASIRSPNCATVFDYGETPDGHLYIVMEYLVGQSLAEVLRDTGPMPLEQFMDWFDQVCAGVQAAHRMGLVHRDLKPENLFVESNPDGVQIKVLDFGLTKILRGEGQSDVQGLTRPGLVFGTPQYMSPEQARGETVDARTDIYALGLIAYECLTGQPAFAGRTPEALLIAQASAPPPDVSAIRNDIPRTIRQAIHQCLSKAPDERFTSVADLRSAIANAEQSADVAPMISDTATMSPMDAFPLKMDSSARHDMLSPVVAGTAHPAPETSDMRPWMWGGLVILFLCAGLLFWWSRPNTPHDHPNGIMDSPTPRPPLGATVTSADITSTHQCDGHPVPAYSAAGHPCMDENTTAYWNFDSDYLGRGPGLPDRVPKPGSPDAVTLISDGVFSHALNLTGQSDSRLKADRPYSIGDRFTIEGWLRPHGDPEIRCGQSVLGTAEVSGARQCFDLRIRSGWAVLIQRGAEQLYDLTFHCMNHAASSQSGGPIQVSLGGPTPLLEDQWNHFAIVSDGTSVVVMVNGRTRTYDRAMRIHDRFGYYNFGGYRNRTDGMFTGAIDEVRLSDTHRSIERLKSVYTQVKARLSSSGSRPSAP